MSAPTTLRRLAGLPASPTPLSQCALVMIDAQNTYRSGTMELAGIEAALDQCSVLLKRARVAGIPIFHIQHDAGAGSPYDIRTEFGAIAEKVRPIDGELVVVKHYPNSFWGTDLNQSLQAQGIKRLIVAGFMSHMCINSTVRGAFNLGYSVTVAADTTATRALPTIDGGSLAAETVQEAALSALADMFAIVVPRQADIPD